MKTKNGILSLVFFTISFVVFSQDGLFDISFENDGYVITDINGGDDIIYSVEQAFDEKLLIIGTTENTNLETVILKYLPNGDIDLSFGNNGIVYPSYNMAFYNNTKLIINPDNSFFVLGSKEEDFFIAKHLYNGDLDNTFGVNGSITTNFDEDNFHTAILQDDGKVVAVGRTSDAANNYQIMMVRYFSNGDLDPTFGNNGIALYDAGGEFFRTRKVLLQNDGKVLLQLAEYTNTPRKLVVYRFMPNGSIDNSFGNNGKIIVMEDTWLNGGSMALKPDGKIITTASNPDSGITKINQYLTNGLIDVSFADNGEKIYNSNDFFTSKLFFKENRMLVYGHVSEFEGTTSALIRFTENGELDPAFGSNGSIHIDDFQSYDVIVQSDDKIVRVGSTYWYEGIADFVLTRHSNSFLGTPTQNLTTFTFYPNPSKGIFNITNNLIVPEKSYQISDITGKIIQQGKLSSEQTQIDISQFENGVYLFTSEGSTIRLLKN